MPGAQGSCLVTGQAWAQCGRWLELAQPGGTGEVTRQVAAAGPRHSEGGPSLDMSRGLGPEAPLWPGRAGVWTPERRGGEAGEGPCRETGRGTGAERDWEGPGVRTSGCTPWVPRTGQCLGGAGHARHRQWAQRYGPSWHSLAGTVTRRGGDSAPRALSRSHP